MKATGTHEKAPGEAQAERFSELTLEMEAQLSSYPGRDNTEVRQSIVAEYREKAQQLLGGAALISHGVDNY
jgi:hypothetical protein